MKIIRGVLTEEKRLHDVPTNSLIVFTYSDFKANIGVINRRIAFNSLSSNESYDHMLRCNTPSGQHWSVMCRDTVRSTVKCKILLKGTVIEL